MSDSTSHQPRTGRRTVLAMFGFGIVMVSLLFLYWELYTRPFRPLQNAIAAAYPGARPNVIGGRHKSHEPGHPETLRIVVQLPLTEFNPEQSPEKSEAMARHLVSLASENLPIANYEVVEVHLVQRPPEQEQRLWSAKRPLAEWEQLLHSNEQASSAAHAPTDDSTGKSKR